MSGLASGPMVELRALDVDASKATVFGTLFVFSLVLPARLDGTIAASYWVVFLPIWILFAAVLVGCIGAMMHWWRHGGNVQDRRDYLGVLGVSVLMAIVFPFAVMACANASGSSQLDWRVVFIPLYIVPFPALALSIVNRFVVPKRIDGDNLMEDFWALSFFTSLFLALRMSGATSWPWRDVLVPLWILYTVFLLGVLALIGRVAYSLYDRNEGRAGRLVWATLTVLAILLVVPSFAFLILLTMNLEGASALPWSTVFAPLNVSLGVAMWLAFVRPGGNPCWMGHLLRRPTAVSRWLHNLGVITYMVPARNADPPDLQLHLGVTGANTSSARAALTAGGGSGTSSSGAELGATHEAVVPPKSPSLWTPL